MKRIGLQEACETGGIERDAMLLHCTQMLLEHGTPGPVVRAIIEEMSSDEYKVLKREDHLKMMQEPGAVRDQNDKQIHLFWRDVSEDISKAITRIELLEKGMAEAAKLIEHARTNKRARRLGISQALQIVVGTQPNIQTIKEYLHLVLRVDLPTSHRNIMAVGEPRSQRR